MSASLVHAAYLIEKALPHFDRDDKAAARRWLAEHKGPTQPSDAYKAECRKRFAKVGLVFVDIRLTPSGVPVLTFEGNGWRSIIKGEITKTTARYIAKKHGRAVVPRVWTFEETVDAEIEKAKERIAKRGVK